ncbi:MAG: site-specific integrase [Rhodobacteraceae bacterium]|nr:site-specific integrase [Paracoccaceae bacterium]
MDKTRISRRAVDAMTPRDKRYYVWDTQLAGFGVKVLPSGRKTFVYKYRTSGGRAGVGREPVIGVDGTVTPDQARKVAQHWAAKIALGEDPAADRQTARSSERMSELFERYLRDHAELHKKPTSLRNDRATIENMLRPAFGATRVKDITRGEIAKWHSKLRETPYAANRALALLSKALNLAEVWGLREPGSNPCRQIKKFKEERRERYLSEAEFGRLFDVLDEAEIGDQGAQPVVSPYAIAAIRLLILTGARTSEILGLQWDWVDFESNVAVLPDSKTGRRTLYLSSEAMAVLTQIPRLEDNPFVIAGSKAGRALVNLKRPWTILRATAGLQDVRLHDLRHSYASVAAAAGMSLPQIGALLGHNSPQTTARYAHLADSVQHQSAAEIGARIGRTREVNS